MIQPHSNHAEEPISEFMSSDLVPIAFNTALICSQNFK